MTDRIFLSIERPLSMERASPRASQPVNESGRGNRSEGGWPVRALRQAPRSERARHIAWPATAVRIHVHARVMTGMLKSPMAMWLHHSRTLCGRALIDAL